MRLIGIIIIGLALVLSGVVYFVVPKLMRSPAPQAQQAQAAQLAAKEVLVAAHTLPAGQVLKAEDMRWQKWPEQGLDPNYLVHEKGADPKNEVGMIVLHGIETGEPILSARLLKAGDTSFMAAELPPGMRAISIKIDGISATSGFILPGDYVDVLLSEHYTVKSNPQQSQDAGPPPFDTREINTIVLRLRMRDDPTFRELIRRSRETAVSCYGHQELPFEKVVQAVRPRRRSDRNPLFQLNLRMQGPAPSPPQLPGVTTTRVDVGLRSSRFDLALGFVDAPGDLHGYVEYNSALWERSTIVRWSEGLTELLRLAATDPDQPISAIAEPVRRLLAGAG